MVKAEAKYYEAKENYYEVSKRLKARPNIEPTDSVLKLE